MIRASNRVLGHYITALAGGFFIDNFFIVVNIVPPE